MRGVSGGRAPAGAAPPGGLVYRAPSAGDPHAGARGKGINQVAYSPADMEAGDQPDSLERTRTLLPPRVGGLGSTTGARPRPEPTLCQDEQHLTPCT